MFESGNGRPGRSGARAGRVAEKTLEKGLSVS
jgi:hypothetical protein